MAVGDALGTTFEFKRIDQPPYPTLATGPAEDVVGKGPFGLDPGQITDDTQLAVCLARNLASHGKLEVDDLARRYIAWMEHAFDIGGQTRGSITRLADGIAPAEAGLATWRAGKRMAAGNGSLMRTAPIGVAYANRPGLVEAAIDDSLLTHADPRCVLACAAFDSAIAAAVSADAPLTGAELVAAAREGLAQGAKVLAARWRDSTEVSYVETAAADLESDLAAALADDPEVYRPGLHLFETQGFVRVAFRVAFWHGVHTRSWRDALIDVASRGGDADTNAAIAGALLGARDGEEAIPAAWRARVLAATQPGPPEWAEAHHPRHLLALVG